MQAAQKTRVLILGSGWGGFSLARRLDRSKFEATLVSPANHFLFTPLLPSTTVGTLEFRCVQEPVRTIQNLRYVQAKATSIDFSRKIATVRDIFKGHDHALGFDKLVLAVGCKTHTYGTPGVEEREREGQQVFYLKHLYHARKIRNRILELFERAALPDTDREVRRRLLSFVVVGGGPTSCEFTSELFDFLKSDVSRWYPDLVHDVRVTLVEAGAQLLGPFDRSLREYALRLFVQRDVDVRLGVSVAAVRSRGEAQRASGGELAYNAGAPTAGDGDCDGNGNCDTLVAVLSDGSEVEFGLMVWSAGLRAVRLTDSLGLPRARSGRVLIDGSCRVRSFESSNDFFAIGDCAVQEERPLAQIAQVASQQGAYVASVINSGKPPESEFHFFSLGAMVSLGDFQGAYDGSHVGDPHGKELHLPKVSGPLAWLMWRGGYTARQVSFSNMLLIPMHWFKSMIFGRDISRF